MFEIPHYRTIIIVLKRKEINIQYTARERLYRYLSKRYISQNKRIRVALKSLNGAIEGANVPPRFWEVTSIALVIWESGGVKISVRG